ncbi:hypothetical protein V8D89_003486 [Ganoderma adspersum]
MPSRKYIGLSRVPAEVQRWKMWKHGIKDVEHDSPKAILLLRAAWDYIPVPILKWIKYLPMNPFKCMLNLNNLIKEYGKQILRQQGPEVDAERKVNGKDVRSLLIKANSSADAKTGLDDEKLIAEMFSLTLAGHETTSSTLAFLLVTARGGNDFTTEDLDSLSVNAIKETLRLHPIVTGLSRIALKHDVIPLASPIISSAGETISEVPIKAGQVFYASFADTNDADVWNRDRFLHIETAKQPASVGVIGNLMAFSAGIRACIGWKFSFIEMQAFLAELVEAFQFDLPREKMEIQIQRGKPELGATLPLRISLAL